MSKIVQQTLKTLGYDPGEIDGKMGTRSKAALKEFQQANGLVVDGIAGKATLKALGIKQRIDPVAFVEFAPNAVAGTLDALELALTKYPVLAEAAVLDDWLGQMWVESQGFSVLVENLNYSVEGLREKFGQHRITDAQCQQFGRKPGRPANQEAIANIIYGGEWGRINLGNTLPGDGWLMRGSGVKQITGRRNVLASGYTPEELRTDIVKSADAAAKFFISHDCIHPARVGDISMVTRRVNGGANGLKERIAKTAEARKVIL